MKLKSSYKILPNLELVVEYFKGKITFENFINHKEKLFSDKLFKHSYKYINDFRDADFLVDNEDIINFIKFEKERLKKNIKNSLAIITNTPKQVMITRLYAMEEENITNNVEVFSTINAAIVWTEVPNASIGIIHNVLNELKEEVDDLL